MSIAGTHDRLLLPASLQNQLRGFRRRVWSVKLLEACAAAAFGVLAAFLLMFLLDRLWDSPVWLRAGLFVAAAVGCANVPLAVYRWVVRHHRPDQLARLLGRKQPLFGDQLLGVVELVRSESEQARSRDLCEAAIRQVADEASRRDFGDALPSPRHRLWGMLAAVPAVLAAGLFVVYPAATSNAWARLLAPWKAVPRFTFAALEPLPGRLVVAHGEPFSLSAQLTAGALWRPKEGSAQLGTQAPVAARLRDGRYEFSLPPQLEPAWIHIRIGDSREHVYIQPTLRPELTSVVADVALPDYLGLPEGQHKDVRGGAVALVNGSLATFAATAGRVLSAALVDGTPRTPAGATISSPAVAVEGARTLEFRWQDRFGLSGKEPFLLTVSGRDDEVPSLTCEDLPRQRVILDTEQFSFKVKAADDFGIKQVGLEWQGAENPVVKSPAKGERILAAGGNDKENLELTGTFSAQALGIEPQLLQVRVFVEDYYPDRPRVYSPAYTFYVLNAEQHAIWLTEQLSKWHRQSLEVRDRELQLFETNKQLRALAPDELDRPETRRRVENQAAAELANGRRLTGLVTTGEDLVRQATRNPEFGVGHLEKWAEMLQILKDIAGNRMPSVADLLKQAAQAPSLAVSPPSNTGPLAGQIRGGGAGAPSEKTPDAKGQSSSVPQLVDRESSQQPVSKNAAPPAASKPSAPRLGLLQTTITSAGKAGGTPPPPQESLEEAVVKQQDLLAEFDKIADELNRVLASLEGSTLVKRLKAASRLQDKISGRLGDQVSDAFGRATGQQGNAAPKVLGELADQEAKESQVLSVIMDDIQAYYERRRFMRFKTVLDEMKKQDVIGSLRQLGDDLKKEHGVSIAQCEFWSDTMDRWADDLVDPAASGSCPGGKSRSSLPPSVVLEVLLILEGEVNLREETRVAEQARPALKSEEYGRQADQLSGTQKGLTGRVEKVTERIRDLPDGTSEFAPEIQLLGQVATVMSEASGILARPETGSPAIAAETEAIELLLQSRRINPKAGGGGGSSPGGGGTGKTQDSALALLGGGVNEKEVREDRGISQATGDSGPVLPEEFRAGLDEYFNRLEGKPRGR
jgi:hypothetical protein